VKYSNVKKGHIVPATYLRNFALDGEDRCPPGEGGHDPVRRVEKVATRTRPYLRKRLDGTYINDIEWSLGELEGIAALVLREFDDRLR